MNKIYNSGKPKLYISFQFRHIIRNWVFYIISRMIQKNLKRTHPGLTQKSELDSKSVWKKTKIITFSLNKYKNI